MTGDAESEGEIQRPRRRATKVDYTERREDYWEVETNGNSATAAPAASTGRKKSRKSPTGSPSLEDANKNYSNGGSSSNGGNNSSSSNFPLNYQPGPETKPFSQTLDLKGAVVKDGLELVLANGEVLKKNDDVFLVCEPPGEPYYVGRIMAFRRTEGSAQSREEPAVLYHFQINWYYRARDISRRASDSRQLFASMHSDSCPLHAYRGRCIVAHREEIADLAEFYTKPGHFWFDRLFDRYMLRFYDVLPTAQLTNLPKNYHEALCKRFQYVFTEVGRARDLLQSPKSCSKCGQWCNSSESVQCCECQEKYHMLCLDPPLYKKPARGFAWSCIKCTKKLEHSKMIPTADSGYGSENEEEKENPAGSITENLSENMTGRSNKIPFHEELAIQFLNKDKGLTFRQRRNKEEWSYRYLGMHAKLEDALDVQDRPYPRAASRLGTKHQLTGIQDWYDHPVVYYDISQLLPEYQKSNSITTKKKKIDGRKNRKNQISKAEDELISKQPLSPPNEYKDVDPEDFPPWLQERPNGYNERGGDSTATLMWKQPLDEAISDEVDQYIKESAPIAESLDLLANTPNFMDQILKNLLDSNYDFVKAKELNKSITRESLKEPTFSKEEVKRFESGVKEFGSELYPVYKKVKTQPSAMVVRFYYLWKKTKNGHLIWDNYEGRIKKQKSKRKLDDNDDDVGNANDDSSYDIEKSAKKVFQCKHCRTHESVQWFKAPGQPFQIDPKTAKQDKSVMTALCIRCARLWRRYAVVWEDPNEVMRKVGQKGGNGWKKKVETELLKDSELILKAKLLFDNDLNNKLKRKSTHTPDLEDSIPSSLSSGKKIKKESRNGNKSASPDNLEKTKTKEKRPYNKKSNQEKLEMDALKTELLISNILLDSPNVNLQTSIMEKYYRSTSPNYNTRIKFKEIPIQRSPLISQMSSKLTKPFTKLKKCAVCLEAAESHDSLFCYNCGVSTHPECYGIEFEGAKAPLGSYKWFCDVCSNSLNPIVSTDDRCYLCDNGSDEEFPINFALKRTNDGRWVHLICAIFNQHVEFDDFSSLQPVMNSNIAIAQSHSDHLNCNICDSRILMKDLMRGDTGERIGFRLIIDAKPDSKSIKVDNNFGKLFPIAICRKHDNESIEYLPLTKRGKRYKQTVTCALLKLYLEDYRKNLNGNGLQARFKEMKFFQNLLRTEQKSGEETDEEDSTEPVLQCDKCNIQKTIKWADHNGKKLCFNCSLENDSDFAMKDASDDTIEEEEEKEPFEKIAEICNAPLDGTLYGIDSEEDVLVRPIDIKQEFSPVARPTLSSTNENGNVLSASEDSKNASGSSSQSETVIDNAPSQSLPKFEVSGSRNTSILETLAKELLNKDDDEKNKKMSIGNILV